MNKKKKVYLVIVNLLLLLLSFTTAHAEPRRVTENLRKETVVLPPSAPETGRLVLVSFSMIALEEGETTVALAVYNDPQTRWSVDYLELYDQAGGLLSVSWVDSNGIRRTAVDIALLQEEAFRLEGVLVLLPEGTPA